MNLPSELPRKIWPILGLLFLIFLLLGTVGWWRTLEEATGHAEIDRVLENVAEMVTGHDVVVVDHRFEENWMLLVGKWGIKAVLGIALLRSFFVVFHRQIRSWRFRKVHDHQVFVGLGGQNADLALQQANAGKKVAVLAEDEQHPRRYELEKAGVFIISGMTDDKKSLKIVGIERAARIVLAVHAGDDACITSAELITSMISTSQKSPAAREMLVCMECRQIRDLFNQRWKLVNDKVSGITTKIVNFESVALRQMVHRMALELANHADALQHTPSILVVADPTFAKEFLRAAISIIQVSGETLPEYWVAIENPQEGAEFMESYPAVCLVAKINFFVSHSSLAPIASDLSERHFDFAIVKQRTESATIHLASRVIDSPIFTVERAEAIVTEPMKARLQEDDRLRVSSLFELGLKSPEFGDDTLELAARANHEAYLSDLPPDQKAHSTEWLDLPENLKESNRLAVLHRTIKQAMWKRFSQSETESLLEHLSISEHQRWMGEKAMDGWRYADIAIQNRMRRLHPSLVSWKKLEDKEKNKDRLQVKKALGLLEEK